MVKMYVRIYLVSPSGNEKTRFQVVHGSIAEEKMVPALAQYAAKHLKGFTMTYARTFLHRDADEMARVNRILCDVGC